MHNKLSEKIKVPLEEKIHTIEEVGESISIETNKHKMDEEESPEMIAKLEEGLLENESGESKSSTFDEVKEILKKDIEEFRKTQNS